MATETKQEKKTDFNPTSQQACGLNGVLENLIEPANIIFYVASERLPDRRTKIAACKEILQQTKMPSSRHSFNGALSTSECNATGTHTARLGEWAVQDCLQLMATLFGRQFMPCVVLPKNPFSDAKAQPAVHSFPCLVQRRADGRLCYVTESQRIFETVQIQAEMKTTSTAKPTLSADFWQSATPFQMLPRSMFVHQELGVAYDGIATDRQLDISVSEVVPDRWVLPLVVPSAQKSGDLVAVQSTQESNRHTVLVYGDAQSILDGKMPSVTMETKTQKLEIFSRFFEGKSKESEQVLQFTVGGTLILCTLNILFFKLEDDLDEFELKMNQTLVDYRKLDYWKDRWTNITTMRQDIVGLLGSAPTKNSTDGVCVSMCIAWRPSLAAERYSFT